MEAGPMGEMQRITMVYPRALSTCVRATVIVLVSRRVLRQWGVSGHVFRHSHAESADFTHH